MTDGSTPKATHDNPALKAAIDYAPLVVFLLAYLKPDLFRPLLPAFLYEGEKPGMFVGTAVLMPTALIAVAASWLAFRRVPVMLWFTALMVAVFGSLTLFLHDPEFIKMKLTIIYTIFGLLLLGGLAFGKVFLPMVLEGAMRLDAAGWRMLTRRWGWMFLSLAVLNEIIRRTQSDDFWVLFKFPGTAILIFAFMMTQVPMIMKHEVK